VIGLQICTQYRIAPGTPVLPVYRSRAMSGYCEPWPGNMKATAGLRPLRAGCCASAERQSQLSRRFLSSMPYDKMSDARTSGAHLQREGHIAQ